MTTQQEPAKHVSRVHYSREVFGIACELLDYGKESQIKFEAMFRDYISGSLGIEVTPTKEYLHSKVLLSEALLSTLETMSAEELEDCKQMPLDWVFRLALTNSELTVSDGDITPPSYRYLEMISKEKVVYDD